MTDSVETIRCSNCKRNVLSSNFMIHDAYCQLNIYLCPKCNEPQQHINRAEHEKTSHVVVSCNGCHTQLEKYLLKHHLKHDCSQRKVKCKICDIEIRACDIDDHENYCGARTEKCPECGEYVMLKYKQLHLESNHTFIKLSDEPGPSSSWQNGRRTLGNFFPDLQSGLYTTNASHQKKRLGRNVNICHLAEDPSLEYIAKGEKTNKLTSPSEKQKCSGFRRNIDTASSSHLKEYRRRDSSGGSEYDGRRNIALRDSIPDEQGAAGKEVISVDKVNSSLKGARSKEKEFNRFRSVSPKQKHDRTLRDRQKGNAEALKQYDADEEANLALAIQLSVALNERHDQDKATGENAAVLSQFRPIDKNKAMTDKNLSKNVYSGKKQCKPSLKYDDVLYDDEFLLYSKSPGKDRDETSLPCEFCDSLYPSHKLMSHQRECKFNGNLNLLETCKYQKKRSRKVKEL